MYKYLFMTLLMLVIFSVSTMFLRENMQNKKQVRMLKASVMIVEPTGTGSGTIIKSTRVFGGYMNYVITAAHVVNKKGRLKVRMWFDNGKTYSATIIMLNKERDLALLVFMSKDRKSYVRLGSNPTALDEVYAIGSPYGLKTIITKGVVSRIALVPNFGLRIFASAQVAPGNSGGGLFDTKGNLVGVVTMVWGTKIRSQFIPISHIGFSVPISAVKSFLMK